ncbi:penicillin-binding protein 1A [Ramlibacter aquaticus]|uniref:penicillin-binding protein 1A n=1 Tax=Ramlibacter aquaticus TaxID=2780094 RepID=UPI0038999A1A
MRHGVAAGRGGRGRAGRQRGLVILLALLLVLPLLALAGAGLWAAGIAARAPTEAQIQARPHSEYPAVILSADGRELASFRRTHREWVRLDEISKPVVQALLDTEDRRFYQHGGLDLRRTLSAAWHTVRGDLQGGSTLTQQLARNLFPEEIGRAPTLERKIKEAVTALRLEHLYRKDQILEMYLNTVPFLYNAYGIEMAARTYFQKSAGELDTLEAATLVGMLKGTTYYNPVLNPDRARARRNIVLAQMARAGDLGSTQLAQLQARPLGLDFERQEDDLGIAPHVAQQLRQWLSGWADDHGYNMYTDGLVVQTTIDSRLQTLAAQAVARQGERLQALAVADRKRRRQPAPPLLEVAFLAQDPANGHIKAWIGSRNFRDDQFDHVAQARRQPGSTFKPFVYGAAFAQGINPGETYLDQAVEIPVGNGVWKPGDVHETTGLPTTLRDGLVYSKNSITAQLVQRVGAAPVAKLAQAMGVRQSHLDVVPSLALGTSPVTLKEMVSAYGTIANDGRYIEPVLVTQVRDRHGRVLQSFAPPAPEAALDPEADRVLLDVMRGVVDEGTGAGIRSRFGLRGDLAGKTGTTQDNTDGWFILMHPQLVAGAWVGFNDPRNTMPDAWGQGARNALLVVGDFAQQAEKARLMDPRAVFQAPHVHYEPPPDPSVMDRMNQWIQSVFQGNARVETPAAPPVAIGTPAPPPREVGNLGAMGAGPPGAMTPDGGIRILREGRP